MSEKLVGLSAVVLMLGFIVMLKVCYSYFGIGFPVGMAVMFFSLEGGYRAITGEWFWLSGKY